MRKIKLLLVAVLALVGLSAFAQVPANGTTGYLYDAVGNKFIAADGKVSATEGVLFKVDTSSGGTYETKDGTKRNFSRLRFRTNANSKVGLGVDDAQKIVVTNSGKYGYGNYAIVPGDEKGFRIMSPYNNGLNVDMKNDYCLGYKEDGTLFFFPEAEAPIWQLIDQETYDLLTTGLSTNVPADGAVGYLFAPSAMKFIAGDVEVGSKKQAVTGITGIKLKAILDGGKYRFETELKQSEDSNDGGKNKGKETRLSRCETQTDNSITVTQYYGWSKWSVKAVDGQGFRLANGYGSGQGNCIAIEKDKTLTLVAEAEAPCWIFVDQDAYDKLSAVLLEVEPEPEAPKVFPETGAAGYLYNPATGKFIDANGAIGVTGAQYAIYRKGSDNKDTDIRFGVPGDEANKHLRINGDNPVLQANDPYYSKWGYEVKDDGKFLLKAGYDYAYGCTKGNYLTIKADGTIEYVATATDASYWQFVDQETYETLVSTPVYYLKNAESGLFFGGENNWGTRGTVSARGDLFKLVKLADGEYAIQNTLVSINDNKLGSNIYVDNAGAKGGWTITNVGDGKYTIYNAEVVSGGYLAQGTEQLARGYAAVGVADVTDAAKWYILTKEEAVAQMGTATVENPLPATFLIKNPGFNRNYSTADWKMEASNQNLCGGTNDNKCAESYHANFTLTQTIEGVPNGVYVLTAQGFYRQDGGNNDDLPVFYGNQMTGKFPLKTGTENSMDHASGSFDKGLYTIDPIYVQVTNNKLTVGAKLAGNTALWCIWDNFQLSYIGNADAANEIAVNAGKQLFDDVVAEAKALATAEMDESLRGDLKELIAEIDGETFTTQRGYVSEAEYVLEAIQDAKASAAIHADYRAALAAARAIFPETMPTDKLVALDKAIKDYAESKVLVDGATDASINEAANAIWAAYYDAANFVNSGSALMGMYELMEHNNVVTPEAYETYFNKFEALSKQWQAGTLAEAVVNPYNLNGWHANLDYDDYLLSTWTVGGEQAQNYDKALYINTWSTEGEGDGTDFKVPFFEYWTGDANSLGKNELVATLNDIEPGIYEVSAWVRVRAKNGTQAADATGITLQLNDGDAVDVTEGDAVGQFNLAEYVAEGEVEEGTLKVKFTVAEGNNISWLSFQNVKYTKTGDIATAISEVGNKATAKTIFNVAGQQMNGLQKGLNIVDGKKVYIK